ncbi:MAG: hypothetical protein F4Y21_04300, partial [Gemmatimonadetes bacterium]|nr:hypothetical protein [Gemmatimonadota bacterium]
MNRVLWGAALSLAGMALLSGSVSAQGFGDRVVVAGDQILVAESRNFDGGVVYIYTRGADGWVESGRLTAPEPVEGDGFGTAMAVSGDRLLVASFSPFPSPTGAVHSFVREGSEWRRDGMIGTEGLPEGVIVGNAAVLSGDLAALSAGSPQGENGRVLLFRNVGGAWVQEGELESPGADGFGSALALSDDLLVVGASVADSASGAAFVFERGADGWSMTAELESDGEPGGYFGSGALIAGDRVLVATRGAIGGSGTVTAFAKQDGEWSEVGRFAAFDGGAGDRFGWSMASDGATVWIGASGVNGRQGGIYEFSPDANGMWTSVNKVTLPEPELGDGLGGAVAQSGDLLVSGMPGNDYGAGTVQLFERDGEGWRAGTSLYTE